MASEGDRRSDSEVELERTPRAPAITGRRGGGGAVRSALIALASTVLFLAAVAFVVSRSSNWPEVRAQFFDWDIFKASMPDIRRAFLLNVKIFCIAEAFILVLSLLLAVIRGLPNTSARFLAHDHQAYRPVRHVHGDIDSDLPIEAIQIGGDGLPIPIHVGRAVPARQLSLQNLLGVRSDWR